MSGLCGFDFWCDYRLHIKNACEGVYERADDRDGQILVHIESQAFTELRPRRVEYGYVKASLFDRVFARRGVDVFGIVAHHMRTQ